MPAQPDPAFSVVGSKLIPAGPLAALKEPTTEGCEECLKTGDRWVHVRMCLTCGKVGCCDSSKNKHATKHFHATGHPIMRSIESGESWKGCYVDGATVE